MITLNKMTCEEDVNCYCFNPGCNKSIFNIRDYTVVRQTLSNALTKDLCCPECGRELICKPILDVRLLMFNALSMPLQVSPY